MPILVSDKSTSLHYIFAVLNGEGPAGAISDPLKPLVGHISLFLLLSLLSRLLWGFWPRLRWLESGVYLSSRWLSRFPHRFLDGWFFRRSFWLFPSTHHLASYFLTHLFFLLYDPVMATIATRLEFLPLPLRKIFSVTSYLFLDHPQFQVA